MQVDQQIVLSNHEQRKVWDPWLSAEIRGCYFAELAGTYHSRQKFLTWATLLSSSGAFLAIATHWALDWPKMVLAFVTTALSLVSLVQRYEERAVKCSDLHADWNRFRTASNHRPGAGKCDRRGFDFP